MVVTTSIDAGSKLRLYIGTQLPQAILQGSPPVVGLLISLITSENEDVIEQLLKYINRDLGHIGVYSGGTL